MKKIKHNDPIPNDNSKHNRKKMQHIMLKLSLLAQARKYEVLKRHCFYYLKTIYVIINRDPEEALSQITSYES